MKYHRNILMLLLMMVLTAFQPLNKSRDYVKIVVIDPGHGGKDPGCVFGTLYEKDIALDISLELGRIIKENFPDVKVVYTRDKDEFIGLFERAEIANKNNANVFISVHVNANANTAAIGTETWVMGLHKSEANLKQAMRENSVIYLEDNYVEKYDGFNPNSPEAFIIFSLYQDAFLEQSLNLADKIENEFVNRVQRKSRGVKQAGFLVLWKTSMPSVLVETGFISNKEDRDFISSKTGQVYLASAIFRAFRDFKKELESN